MEATGVDPAITSKRLSCDFLIVMGLVVFCVRGDYAALVRQFGLVIWCLKLSKFVWGKFEILYCKVANTNFVLNHQL